MPDDRQRTGALAEAAADYHDLVTRAAPRSVTHDTLVSLTVDLAALPARRSRPIDAVASGLQLLVDELRLFTGRLETAGLHVDTPLSPAEVVTAVRQRSAPFAEPQHRALSMSLAARLGVTADDMAPMAITEEWDHARIDRGVQRSWWVEGWPRSEVPAVWMDLLLLGDHCTRTVTVVFEPISPSQPDPSMRHRLRWNRLRRRSRSTGSASERVNVGCAKRLSDASMNSSPATANSRTAGS